MISLSKIKGNYKKNFSLSKLTWFQSGGNAEYYFMPKDIEDLKYFLKQVKKIPIHIIGGGSNILVRDGGVSGVVIKLGKGFDFIEFKDNHILCGAYVIDLDKNHDFDFNFSNNADERALSNLPPSIIIIIRFFFIIEKQNFVLSNLIDLITSIKPKFGFVYCT